MCTKIKGNENAVAVLEIPDGVTPDMVQETGSSMSKHAHIFPCKLPKEIADACNCESGRIYTAVLVEHWRLYRKKGVWLSPYAAQKLNDFYNTDSPKLLHAHSINAAQNGFYRACKVAREARKAGAEVRYPYKRKQFRTTVWKNSGIKVRGDRLRLALAGGQAPIMVKLPVPLRGLEQSAFKEMRLVYGQSTRRYRWHHTRRVASDCQG